MEDKRKERERETSVVLEWEAIRATKTESVKRKISFYSIIQTTITDYQLDTTFCCSLNRWLVISGGNLTVILYYILKQGLSDKSDHIQQILIAKDLYPNFSSWHSERFHLFSYSSFTLSSVQTQLLWVWTENQRKHLWPLSSTGTFINNSISIFRYYRASP